MRKLPTTISRNSKDRDKRAAIPGPAVRKRKNASEPQVMVPHDVQLPLAPTRTDEVRVPAGITGGHLATGRL